MNVSSMPAARIAATLLLLASVLATTGCGGFQREWVQANGRRDAFAGPWKGEWRSERHPGEGGQLRCIFTPVDTGHYRAHFEAHWKVFASSYVTVFETHRRGRALHFEGTHELPSVFGGVYRYEGQVTPEAFSAHYDSRYDSGVFRMTRP